MIENIDKPALSALWPNKKGMSVVLDLGANIECSSKNLVDFSIMGASLYKSLYPNENPNVALLNIGSEELKGNETIKETDWSACDRPIEPSRNRLSRRREAEFPIRDGRRYGARCDFS